jgi:hypothetical protein
MIPHPITQNPERPLIRDLPFAIVIACERVLKLLASVVTGSSRIEASLGYSRGGNIFPDLRSYRRQQSPEEKRAQSACDELIDKGAIITGE